MRQAVEEDFRQPEFKGENPDDYEIRPDGKCVRKDRWEMGMQRVRELVGIEPTQEWEISDVVNAVKCIIKQ